MSTANDWMDGWMDAQRAYWQSWANLARRGTPAPEAPGNPFTDGLSQWWRTLAPMAPDAGKEVFDRLIQASQGYFSLAERFMAGADQADNGMKALDDWLDGMRGMWDDWSRAGSTFAPGMAGMPDFKGLTTFWDLPMDTWNRLAANVMPMPGDFTRAFHPEGANPAHEQINRFLSIPAVGYTRESQEQYQALARKQMDYLAATQAYQAAFGKLGATTTTAFQHALRERAREDKPIGSLRELYDLWVEMSEAAYADFVMTNEYQTLYGRLVNTLLALKQQMARMVDQGLEAMNMPTHAEISTLQCRQQELRRENLRLNREIKEMRKQLDALVEQLATAPGHAPAPESAEPAEAAPAPKPRARATKTTTSPTGATPRKSR